MPDLLLELFSEEIPARMQAKAADDLRRMVTDRLVAEGLVYEGAKAFATPRRLALTVHGIPARQPDLEGRAQGTARRRAGGRDRRASSRPPGLPSIDEAKDPAGPQEGRLLRRADREAGPRPRSTCSAEILPVIIRTFPWPKSMRWGERSARPGALTWVRPLHAIVATFGLETEEPDIVPFSIDGIAAGQTTAVTASWRRRDQGAPLRGLRGEAATRPRSCSIPSAARTASSPTPSNWRSRKGSNWSRTQALLDEVAGLVEWPVVLMGSFDEAFLSIPGEVIRATIRNNQKCFVRQRFQDRQARQQIHPHRQYRGD